ncbi:MAG TPA: hypothetical protein ENK05_11140 [Gammaproteobacteria bacterium]|nr:hypothetical protein [Gammaproteobacteria bacterium]
MIRPSTRPYPGIDQDVNGGMTDEGKIIRDAWLFGLLDESETCAGWSRERLAQLWARVDEQWQRYDFLVSRLPPDLYARFERIQAEALERARAAGWNPDTELDEDD